MRAAADRLADKSVPEPPSLWIPLIGYGVGIVAYGVTFILIKTIQWFFPINFYISIILVIWGITHVLRGVWYRIRSGHFARGFIWSLLLLMIPAAVLGFLLFFLIAIANSMTC